MPTTPRKFITATPSVSGTSSCPRNDSRNYGEELYPSAINLSDIKIVYEAQVFNLDEGGCSLKTSHRSRTTEIFKGGKRANAVHLEWENNAELVTVITVVSAGGTMYRP